MLNRTIIVVYFILFINLSSLNSSGSILLNNKILNSNSNNFENNLTDKIDNGLYFNISNYSNRSFNLNYNNEILIDNINNSYEVSFSESKSYLDLLKFKSTFVSDIEDLNPPFNVIKLGESIKFSLNDTISSNSLIYNIMQNLTGDEIISLDIINEKWILNSSEDVAYNAIVFHFDNSFTLKLFLESVPQIATNSTENLAIYNFNRNFEFSIKELSILANTTIPAKLNSIEWLFSLNKNYNYNLIMNKFSLFRPISNYNFLINNYTLEINDKFYFEQNKTYTISVNEDIVSIIYIYLEYMDKYLFYPKLYFNNILSLVEIEFNVTYNNPDYNFSSKLFFPESFYNIRYSFDTKNFLFLENNILPINQNYSIKSNIKSENYLLNYNIDKIYQGESLNISIFDRSIYSGIIVNENIVSYNIGNKYNDSLIFTVPKNWPKGEFQSYIIDENYSLLKINLTLKYSPSKIIFPDSIRLDPKIKNIIPIRIKNISSGLNYIPDYIISYFDNDTLRETYENNELVIIDDEFSIGNHKLKLVIKKIGYKDHIIKFNFTITEDYPEIIIESSRDTLTNGTFKISFSEYYWDVQTKLIVNTGYNKSEFIITNNFTTIYLYNELWKNETINLRFIFEFGIQSGELEINVILKPYYLSDNNIIVRNNSLLLSIFSSSVLIVIILKYNNIRKKNKLILF